MRRILLIGMLAAVVLVGCSASARHRLKHWFFDIPDESASGQVDEPEEAAVAPKPAAVPQPKPRFVSMHYPYVNRECSACHNNEQRMRPFEDFIEVCSDCHDEYFDEDEVGHYPVAEGECLTCHQMHRSPYKALLTSAVVDMCAECHDEPEDLSEEAHNGGEGVDDCTRCHDPHFGEPPLLKEGIEPIADD